MTIRRRRLIGLLLSGSIAAGCSLPKAGMTGLADIPALPAEGNPGAPGTLAPAPTELPAKQAARACLEMARTLEAQGQEVDAVAYYERARVHDPSQVEPRTLAVLYDRIGDDRRAAEAYRQALVVSPNRADLHNDLGYFHYTRGQWPEAEVQLRRAVAIDPKDATAWNNLGMTLGEERKEAESLEAFARAVGPARARCNLAFILLTQDRVEEARERYREALKLEPELAAARSGLERVERRIATKAVGPAPGRRSEDRQVVAGQAGQGPGGGRIAADVR